MIEDVFRRLDEQSHYKCRQPNTYLNYVLYTLLRSQNLSEIFRNSKTKGVEWEYIDNLYENLHPYYHDYYMYWLHRGISEIKMRKYIPAEIHIEQARSMRNGYSYEIEHTFAILYFEQAIHCSNISKEERLNLYDNGLKIVKDQMNRETNDAFTIHSFIVKTIEFYDSIGDTIPDDLMKEIIKEYNKARKKFSFNNSIIRRNMFEHLYDYWLDHENVYSCKLTVNQEELAYHSRRRNIKEIELDILDLAGLDCR